MAKSKGTAETTEANNSILNESVGLDEDGYATARRRTRSMSVSMSADPTVSLETVKMPRKELEGASVDQTPPQTPKVFEASNYVSLYLFALVLRYPRKLPSLAAVLLSTRCQRMLVSRVRS